MASLRNTMGSAATGAVGALSGLIPSPPVLVRPVHPARAAWALAPGS